MLKKLFYVGLGISIIAVKKSVSYLLEKRDQVSEKYAADAAVDETVASQSTAAEAADVTAPDSEIVQLVSEDAVVAAAGGETVSEADDLTEINGIGPTYAKRLREAGIATFTDLSKKSPEELRLITKATGKSADAESWIIQAGGL